MFGHKAFSLLEEIDRSDHGIPPYRDALVREVCDEVNELCKSLQHVNESDGEQVEFCVTHLPGVGIFLMLTSQIAQGVMISAILRNRQCLLAYVNRRNRILMEMRWNLGAVVPEDTRYCLIISSSSAAAHTLLCSCFTCTSIYSGRNSPLTSSRFFLSTMACFPSILGVQASILLLTCHLPRRFLCGCAAFKTILLFSRNGAVVSPSARTC
jgi:hypothetical protein